MHFRFSSLWYFYTTNEIEKKNHKTTQTSYFELRQYYCCFNFAKCCEVDSSWPIKNTDPFYVHSD